MKPLFTSVLRSSSYHALSASKSAFTTPSLPSAAPFVLIAINRNQWRQTHSARSTGSKRHASFTTSMNELEPDPAPENSGTTESALSCLPLSVLLRSYVISVISTTPLLLSPSLRLLSMLAHSKSPWLDPDRNHLVRAMIKYTIYRQFCAGTNAAEVRSTLAGLKHMGFTGAILGYAREVVMDNREVDSINKSDCLEGESQKEKDEVASWELGTLKTIELAQPGDFVALKFSGAGSRALSHLAKNCPPTPVLEGAIVNICDKAKVSGVRLLFDAEQAAIQDGIDSWTVEFMQRYNASSNSDHSGAVVYGTYQAYRLSTPGTLASHMDKAQRGGWRLGVKLVRGAYLGSDPRHLFWTTKPDTDKAYNGIAKSLMQRKFGDILKPVDNGDSQVFPNVDLVLAGHNSESVHRAMAIRDEQTAQGEEKTEMVYGQLMGMADHVSCTLIQKAGMVRERESDRVGGLTAEEPRTFKYIVWGTVGECTKYLLRRAQENRDAVERTMESRVALSNELRRRMGL